jgi:hypothetical protein
VADASRAERLPVEVERTFALQKEPQPSAEQLAPAVSFIERARQLRT